MKRIWIAELFHRGWLICTSSEAGYVLGLNVETGVWNMLSGSVDLPTKFETEEAAQVAAMQYLLLR